MTDDRKVGLYTLIQWYWDEAQPKHLLHTSDFEFMYELWRNGVSFYAPHIQKRLNKIREIYYEKSGQVDGESDETH